MFFERQNSEALFLEHLGLIERVAAIVCRQHGIWGADAEDFAASVKVKLMENDYAALRGYRAEAKMGTYLSAVATRHLHDLVREKKGRWRPSAAAERLGPPAGELEALVFRDGYRLDQAGELLRTAGRTSLTDRELARLLERLPPRAPLRPREVPAEAALGTAQDPSRADERVAASEAEARRERIDGALRRALAKLTSEEQIIVRMHLVDGKTVADVARALGLEQKALYRRVDRLRALLREHLGQEGVGPQDVGGEGAK